MDKISKACTMLAEKHYAQFIPCYGEPGYMDTPRGVILADWNRIPRGLGDWLEKCGFSLEWSDEWTEHAGKAYRTSPDSYGWRSSLLLADNGEYISEDDGPDCAIEECAIHDNGQPIKALPYWISESDLASTGYMLFRGDLESGFHPGQTDDPATIAREALRQGAESIVFRVTNKGQFDIHFQCWAIFPAPHYDRFDICAAYAQLENDYNRGGIDEYRQSNIRRDMSTSYQLSRMRYNPSPFGGMTPNAWAIYRMHAQNRKQK